MKKLALDLKAGYELEFTVVHEGYCGDGGMRYYELKHNGVVVLSGNTCACGRGCGNKDCVRDDWGYHDTALEEYRAD